MEALDKTYKLQLDDIIARIQNSEQLGDYLDTEEYEEYKQLIHAFEEDIQVLYQEVVSNNPLQVIAFEKELLDDNLEGLYLPKLVGYSVLRGSVDEAHTYRYPQDHFREILLFIARSTNFGMIRQRVGQSIQTGFALSSDIWITNIIDSIKNKKVSQFLQSQKYTKYRVAEQRKAAREKYARQFASLNFYTAEFPEDAKGLIKNYHTLRHFLIYRAKHDFDNSSLHPYIEAFIGNMKIVGMQEYIELSLLLGMHYELSDSAKESFQRTFASMGEASKEEFSETFFAILDEMHKEGLVDRDADIRLSALVKGHSTDEITRYYELIEEVHGKGFVHEEVIENVRNYYLQHEGLSRENECLRLTILEYFRSFMSNIDEEEYSDYFEITKVVTLYIGIFSNQKFNQSVKDISMVYIKKLLKRYTDKRGRDYQDIKRFVVATFTDLGFMDEKELKELFKTKRKKAAASK